MKRLAGGTRLYYNGHEKGGAVTSTSRVRITHSPPKGPGEAVTASIRLIHLPTEADAFFVTAPAFLELRRKRMTQRMTALGVIRDTMVLQHLAELPIA
jgi:hypothetical protein